MRKLILTIFLSLSVAFIFAQSGIKTDVPMDSTVRYGVLDNGLTYYIKQNKTPKNRAEFYLAVNAGAIQETPGQNGLAHFTEHMCFNGTKNFKKHEIIHYLQSIGMKFGPEINAYTVTDRTVYTLNKVPLEEKANIDTALMILYDWGCNVSEEADEIDAERGVIREEFRTRMSGMARAQLDVQAVMYKGSKYEIHNVIGDTVVINHAPYDTLRAFYKDWYRPDLEAIVVVGDFDPAMMESKVKAMFSKMPVKKNPKKRGYYKVPGHKEPRVAIAKDKEAPYNLIQIVWKHNADWDRSEKYYRQEYLNQLYSTMINARLSELIQSADPPFTYAFSGYNTMLPTVDAYMAFAVAPNNKISTAVQTLIAENERVKRYGFVATELERAKKEMLSSIEKAYKERDKQKSRRIANSLMENYLTSEPIPSDEWEYEFGKKVTREATLEELNALAKKWMTDENIVVGIMGVDAPEAAYPTEQEVKAMLKGASQMKLEPYVDKVANRPLIETPPTPGTIVKEEKDEKEGLIKWTLSNGVKVIIKPTDFKENEILMAARSKGGWSVYQAKDDMSAQNAAGIANNSGVGDFDNIQLQKYLSGKKANVSPFISELYEGFSGNSTVDDFETMLQMTYLYFTKPRLDKDAFESYINNQKTFLQNKSADPSSAFSDSITATLYQHHPRFKPMTADRLKEIKLAKARYIFKERFGDPSDFTFFFVGNIDPQKDKEKILTYLGGLPRVSREESWKDVGRRTPAGVVHNTYHRDLTTPKATVFIAFNGEFKYNQKDIMLLEAVKEYLNERYLQTLREDQGGTYGASVFKRASKYPYSYYYLGVYFDCNPAKLDTMIKIVYDEVEKLKNDGPDAKVINNIIKNKLKDHKEAVKENRYWLNHLVSDEMNDEDYLEFDYEKFWSSLTPKMVHKAAKKFLNENRVVQVVTSSEEIKDIK